MKLKIILLIYLLYANIVCPSILCRKRHLIHRRLKSTGDVYQAYLKALSTPVRNYFASDVIIVEENNGNLWSTDFEVSSGGSTFFNQEGRSDSDDYKFDLLVNGHNSTVVMKYHYEGSNPVRCYFADDINRYKPNIDELQSMNLKSGLNLVEYRLRGSYWTRKTAFGAVYKLSSQDNYVLYDLDQAINKIFYKDCWTKMDKGLLVKFFRKLGNDGFKFIYLSTRDLSNKEQSKKDMFITDNWFDNTFNGFPDGPIILPERLLKAKMLKSEPGQSLLLDSGNAKNEETEENTKNIFYSKFIAKLKVHLPNLKFAFATEESKDSFVANQIQNIFSTLIDGVWQYNDSEIFTANTLYESIDKYAELKEKNMQCFNFHAVKKEKVKIESVEANLNFIKNRRFGKKNTLHK